MRFRCAALSLGLTFVLAACGTTGDAESDSTTTSTSTTTSQSSESTESSTTTTEQDGGEAQDRAEAIDVGVDDLPEGWQAAPHEEDDDSLFSRCSDLDVDGLSLATYFTEDFTLGDLDANDGQTITVGTRVFEDVDTATSVLDVIPDDDFIACVNDELESTFGSVDGEVEAEELSTDVEQTEGFGGQLTVTDASSGEEVEVFVVFVAFRTGDLVTGLSAFGVGQGLDDEAVSAVGDRIIDLQAG